MVSKPTQAWSIAGGGGGSRGPAAFFNLRSIFNENKEVERVSDKCTLINTLQKLWPLAAIFGENL